MPAPSWEAAVAAGGGGGGRGGRAAGDHPRRERRGVSCAILPRPAQRRRCTLAVLLEGDAERPQRPVRPPRGGVDREPTRERVAAAAVAGDVETGAGAVERVA